MISRKEIAERPVEKLSVLFSAMVRYELAVMLPRVVSTNRRYRKEGLDCCATHDYCDANLLMAAAFKQANDREFDADSGADVGMWNLAWKLSFDREFVAQ